MELINAFEDFSTKFISSGGVLYGFLLVLLESVIPALPLGVFVALNVNAFGMFMGIFISWAATCLGCFLSYSLFYYLSNKYIYKFFNAKKKRKIDKAINRIKNISFSNLVLLIALPFTPAFLINILCGINYIPRKKFLSAILLGKVFMIIFWGYVGKSLIESITDISTIIIVSIMLLIAYLLSKIVSKRMNIE